jgi:glutamine amidotransferase
MISIVDYGAGNIGSLLNMISYVGGEVNSSSCPTELSQAKGLIIPGVGAFDSCMSRLNDSKLLETITEKVLGEGVPLLGICVGAQMLFESSEEGTIAGLGLIPGKVRKFRFEDEMDRLKVPHMGWSGVTSSAGHPLFSGLEEDARFYFVHSYHFETEEEFVAAEASYGYTFPCAVSRENIYGVQFHPEKSHKFGMKLLQNFVNLAC